LIVYILAAITTLIIAITNTIRKTDAIKTALAMSKIWCAKLFPAIAEIFQIQLNGWR